MSTVNESKIDSTNADPAKINKEQEHFTKFIQKENERLNLLIRNLYLYLLQFKHYSGRDLYDRICQEVAEYFQATCCDLYLVHYEEKAKEPEAKKPFEYGSSYLSKWVELQGAFGPSRRALHQQYVREKRANLYEIPIDENAVPEYLGFSGFTRSGFMKDEPTRFISSYEINEFHQLSEEKKSQLTTNSFRQVVWLQDGLYNSCRGSLMVPLIRENKDPSRSHNSTTYNRKIGLIKVENRTPNISGFVEISADGKNSSDLFFREEWEIAALRPYIKDLVQNKDPFYPLSNDIGWRQYYEDHLLGAGYFHSILDELKNLRKHRDEDEKATQEKLKGKYGLLINWYDEFVDCLIQLESLFQYIKQALQVLTQDQTTKVPDKTANSFFNIYNLHKAYIKNLVKASGGKGTFEEYNENKCKENFDLLKKRNAPASTGSDSLPKNLYELLIDSVFGFIKEYGGFQENLNNFSEKGDVIDEVLKNCADQIREQLGINSKLFSIKDCISSKPPKWNFQLVLEELVKKFSSIAQSIKDFEISKRVENNQELISEEVELKRVAREVARILSHNSQKEMGETPINSTEIGNSFSNALAVATMYAGSFNEIDEKRLLFISKHIVHVLDNHLLYQAQLRKLEVPSDVFSPLGLEHYGLELLDTLNTYLEKIIHICCYLLKRESVKINKGLFQIGYFKKESLKSIIDLIKGNPLNGIISGNKKIKLLSINYTFELSLFGEIFSENLHSSSDTPSLGIKYQYSDTQPKLQFVTKSNEAISSEFEEIIKTTEGKENKTIRHMELIFFLMIKETFDGNNFIYIFWYIIKMLKDIIAILENSANGGQNEQ